MSCSAGPKSSVDGERDPLKSIFKLLLLLTHLLGVTKPAGSKSRTF